MTNALINGFSSRSFCEMAMAVTTMPVVKATPRKKKKFAKPYQSTDELLQQTEVQSLLNKANLDLQTKLDKSHKIAILAHFSSTLNEPLPSNVFKELHTPKDIAAWFSKKLQPVGARPHARNLIKAVLEPVKSNTSGGSEERSMTEEPGASLDDEIDLSREAIHEKLMHRLPDNLKLDSKTFYKAYPEGLPVKNLRSKGVRPWRKVGEFAWPAQDQARQDT